MQPEHEANNTNVRQALCFNYRCSVVRFSAGASLPARTTYSVHPHPHRTAAVAGVRCAIVSTSAY